MDLEEKQIKNLKLLQKEWEVCLRVQMHFNDMIMKNRTAGITIVGVFLSAGAGAYKFNPSLSYVIIGSAIALIVAFFFLDFFYYFRLLLGAVEKTQEIDNQFKEEIELPGNKRVRLFGLTSSITRAVGDKTDGRYRKSKRLVFIFYGVMFLASLIILYVFIFCQGNQNSKSTSEQPNVYEKSVIIQDN